MSNQPPYGYPPQGGYPGGDYPPPGGYQGGGYPPPPGPPPGKTSVLGLDYKLAALLCYIPGCCCFINVIAAIIWLASEPKTNRFLRFHAMQGLLLFAARFVISIIFGIFGAGVSMSPSDIAAGAASSVLSLVDLLIMVAYIALTIIAMIKAYQGEMWKIPVIGDVAEKNS
ncbi:MAG TPA: DUF4870 domain-containing protein [Blastocatellia bacterium]|nr:DUF4870 domain-containing protein [Blastocatellia bacterium]